MRSDHANLVSCTVHARGVRCRRAGEYPHGADVLVDAWSMNAFAVSDEFEVINQIEEAKTKGVLELDYDVDVPIDAGPTDSN